MCHSFTSLLKVFGVLIIASLCTSALGAENPNIIFIFADDMGVGDVSHGGGKAATPHLDRMAKEGLRFTDAHTTSSVCTPSRYGLLTGRYAWRTRLQERVISDPHDKPLIEKDEPTVASMLRDNGYDTAMVGKWHLGMTWQKLEGKSKGKGKKKGKGWDIDYTKPVVTPRANGFDYFYGIQNSLDMPPYIYIENDKAIHVANVSKGFDRVGAAHSSFKAEECLKVFAQKSVAYIEKQAKTDRPFFLYVPLTSPHTPILPSKEFKGKSNIGALRRLLDGNRLGGGRDFKRFR